MGQMGGTRENVRVEVCDCGVQTLGKRNEFMTGALDNCEGYSSIGHYYTGQRSVRMFAIERKYLCCMCASKGLIRSRVV